MDKQESKRHGLGHSPFGRSSRSAGNQRADAVREFGNSRGGPACANSMEKSCGRSVPGADGVSHFDGKPRRFQIFIVYQQRAAFLAQRDAYGMKVKSTQAVPAELLQLVALLSAHLLEKRNFLLIQLEDVSVLGKTPD